MARKQSNGPLAGEHLALAVAAHLARTQLTADLDAVAIALARNAQLYVLDAAGGEPRQLSSAELEGVAVTRGATMLVLKDGRTLAGVSIRRSELRRAIEMLKSADLQHAAPPPAATADKPAVRDSAEDLRAHLAEVEAMLKPPLLPAQVERAKAAAVWIARHARQGRVANLAMQLMSALHETRGIDEIPGGFRMALARLRAAIDSGTEP